MPFSPGGEASGDVSRVGEGVTTVKEGDAVCFGSRAGGFAEAVNVPAAGVKPIPGKMNYEKAASYGTAYMTAYVALKVRGGLKAGEWLLVHGATGGVGMAAVDLGKHFGAHVIGTGGRDDKLAVVKSRGADAVINYTMPDGSLGGFRDKVKAVTGSGGADVIYDPVGGDVFDESMRCINWRGRILTIGFTSGRWPSAPVNLILIKSISVIGVRAGEIGGVIRSLAARTKPRFGSSRRAAQSTPTCALASPSSVPWRPCRCFKTAKWSASASSP